MTDRKPLAIILGATVGVAAIGAIVAVYMYRQQEPSTGDINDIFDQARQTVKKLDEAVETLRRTAA